MKFLNSFIFQVAVLSALIYAIADFWGLLLTHYLLFGFWVAFSPTMGESIQASIKRLGGILLGGFLGVIFMVSWDESTLTVAIGLFLTVLFCYGIGRPQYLSQALVSFCMVTIGHYSDGLDRYYWERFSYNSLGVITGIIASRLLAPPPAVVQLKKGIQISLMQISQWYGQILAAYMPPTLIPETTKIGTLTRQIEGLLAKNSKLLGFAYVELSQGMGNTPALKQQEFCNRTLQELVFDLKDLEGTISKNAENPLYQELWPEISHLIQTTYQTGQQLGQFSSSQSNDTSMIDLSNLSASLANLDIRLVQLKGTGISHQQDLATVVQLSVFLDDLREIANKLILLGESMMSV